MLNRQEAGSDESLTRTVYNETKPGPNTQLLISTFLAILLKHLNVNGQMDVLAEAFMQISFIFVDVSFLNVDTGYH